MQVSKFKTTAFTISRPVATPPPPRIAETIPFKEKSNYITVHRKWSYLVLGMFLLVKICVAVIWVLSVKVTALRERTRVLETMLVQRK